MTAADRDGHAERSATVIVAVNEVGLPARDRKLRAAWTLALSIANAIFLPSRALPPADRGPARGTVCGPPLKVRLGLPFNRALLSGQKHCYRFRRPNINVDHDGSVFIS